VSKLTKVQREILQEMAGGVEIFGEAPPYWLGMRRQIQGRTMDELITHGWVTCERVLRNHRHAITDAGRAALAEVERIAEAAGKERVGP
jgi:DNA-binding PadR family transcriptional regulator